MKSAMQELIEWANNRVIMRSMISPHELLEQIKTGLEKEKEQIRKAFASGWNWNSDPEKYYQETYVQQEDKTFKQKSKWTSVDNTKQHIIDIMKADEDDGLYNQDKPETI